MKQEKSEASLNVTFVTDRYTFVVVNGFCAKMTDADGKDVASHRILGSRLRGSVVAERPTDFVSSEVLDGHRVTFLDRGVGWITDPVTSIISRQPSEPTPLSRRIIPRPPSDPLILEL